MTSLRLNKLTCYLTLWLCICAPTLLAQLNHTDYKLYATATKSIIDLDSLINSCAGADVIFFGEEHNDSVAHFLETEIWKKLHNRYQRVCLSLEMFERDVQPTMNDYLSGLIREKNFLKDCRVWNNYRDYKPMVEYAKQNKLLVICANAPGRYSNMAGRLGPGSLSEIDATSKKYIAPLPYALAGGGYFEKLTALTSHGKDSTPMPATMNNFNMIAAQSLWDATMAYSIAQGLKAHKKTKVFHVNGRFHSDEHYAVVTQLKNYNAKAKCMVISCFRDDAFNEPNWEAWHKLGDYIIVTNPAVPTTYE